MYKHFLSNVEKIVEIPWLEEGFIPQGLAVYENLMIITSYNKKRKPTRLSFIDLNKKKHFKTLLLHNKVNYANHAGGVAIGKSKVWISDNYKVYEFNLDKLLSKENMSNIKPNKIYEVIVKADFISFSENILWIGEYNYKNIYKTKKCHKIHKNRSLMIGYNLNNKNSLGKVNCILSIPDRCQGFCIYNNQLIFSRSFWSFQNSKLSIYKNVINNKKESNLKYDNLPIHILEKKDLIKNIKMPPMSEGISNKENYVFILFESASNLYKKYTRSKMNYICKLKI